MPTGRADSNGGIEPLLITFLSDYGRVDEFVGVCHGVIARRCPRARVIDITHEVPRHDVREGGLVLRDALPHMPAGVHLAVVDPAVGAIARRAVALRTVDEQRLLVGPDNGLLMFAAERFGGVAAAVDIGGSPERLEPVSATFHGRDIFAPVAAALAAGATLHVVGEEIEADGLRRLALPVAHASPGALTAHVVRADRFGNLLLNASPEQLAEAGLHRDAPLWVQVGGRRHPGRYASTFSDVPPGELLLYEDSLRMAALAVNRGSAAEQLGAGRDQELQVTPA